MTAHSSLRLCVSRSKLTCYRASVSIDATINTVYRFLAVLFLGLASVSFAQVAPIAKPGSPEPSASQDDEEDEATPAPAIAAQPARTPAPPVANQPARPAPSVPRVIATPAQAAQTRPAPAAPPNPRSGARQM